MSSPPLFDAFGTRLDPRALLEGLEQLGLAGAGLTFSDAGVTLRCRDPDPRRDDLARALTWLRTRLSPIVPLTLAPLEAGQAPLIDARSRLPAQISVVELVDPPGEMAAAVESLLARCGVLRAQDERPPASFPPGVEGPLAHFAGLLAAALTGVEASVSVVDAQAGVLGPLAAAQAGAGQLHLLIWLRPGGELGVRRAALIAASEDPDALRWLAAALHAPFGLSPTPDVLIDGLVWSVARRPTVATLTPGEQGSPIRVDPDRCTDCGLCEAICPTDYLGARGLPKVPDPEQCIRCQACVEACPADALRPVYGAEAGLSSRTLEHRPGWLSRLAGHVGPSFPAPFPPSYLLPRPDAPAGPPRYVLGLAVMTMQEHAAVLLRDGVIVGAIEKERLDRRRHSGWHPPGRPGITAAVDPTLAIEQTLCRHPIRALLEAEGLTLDEVDLIAINGLHGRLRHAFSFIDDEEAIPTLQIGRVVYLPHHLCHAASAFRLAGVAEGWVLTLDGRGDRECGAVFRAEGGELRPVRTVLALSDRSIGGVYEGVTRVLGFGSHGQGSTMALAAFGEPRVGMSAFLSVNEAGEITVHETGIDEAFAEHRRAYEDPIVAGHHDLAASLQHALESTVQGWLAAHAGEGPLDFLGLAGGVALNCRMNNRLRLRFSPARIFAQPGANDGGTAMGAALEAWHRAGGAPPARLEHALLGPEFSDAEIEAALVRCGLVYTRAENLAAAVADRLVAGQVLCWFQGKMEFGPRALGARSIVADPRKAEIKDRVNRIKDRQPWRPFGPSILAGHEDEWFEEAFDSRFMLFTLPVRAHKRAEIPAVVHVDGSTRPQVVHAHTHPAYHAMISAFHARTGVPMVVNTSFNRRGEPIVCTPADALESFVELGADALAIGPFIVEHPSRVAPQAPPPPDLEALAQLPGGRRLALRLTQRCDWACVHCTLDDQPRRPDRSFEDALRALARGREAGCDELVILRGEATLRRDLPRLITAARAMGYRFVQLQTNAHALASLQVRTALLRAGVDCFEVTALAPGEALHDRLTHTRGTWRPTLAALRALARAGCELLLSVPVLRENMRLLGGMVKLTAAVGARRIQFSFPRTVELPADDELRTASLPRLSEAAAYVRQAIDRAHEAGLAVSTEGFPLCHLPESLHELPDASEDWGRHRIDDLHVTHDSLGQARHQSRSPSRPGPPPCQACALEPKCPKTWAVYFELFGSGELRPTRSTR